MRTVIKLEIVLEIKKNKITRLNEELSLKLCELLRRLENFSRTNVLLKVTFREARLEREIENLTKS